MRLLVGIPGLLTSLTSSRQGEAGQFLREWLGAASAYLAGGGCAMRLSMPKTVPP
jgi:hypothetical protein